MNPFPDEIDRITLEVDALVLESTGDRKALSTAQGIAHRLYRNVLTPTGKERADKQARRILPFLQSAYNTVMSEPERKADHFAFTWSYPDWLAADLFDGFQQYLESEKSLAKQRGRSVDQHLAEGGSDPE